MPRPVNYEDVLAFRAPHWAKDAADDMRGPGEDRSDVLRDIVLPVLAAHLASKEEEDE
ncbi:MAG TPA: hypothetical protein VNC22_23025 [Sporichthya sp.]|jgi:hypothetical protein|nr:hypothetical protein [Sporichthya sp.]